MKENKKKYEDPSPKVFYPFGFKGKKYQGQLAEKIKCPKCDFEFEVSIIESIDPDWIGYCHATNPSVCPRCNQKFWFRDGFEKK